MNLEKLTAGKKKNGMSREEARALYDDLHNRMTKMMKEFPEGSPPPKPSPSTASKIDTRAASAAGSSRIRRPVPRLVSSGNQTAIAAVIFFALFKAGFAILELSGVAKVEPVQASVMQMPRASVTDGFSREEIDVLKTLDNRRTELETRSKRIEEREKEIDSRDREFISRITQLRELTGRLRAERDKDEKVKDDQIAQLANVYGSMNPPEAAALMEQLDIQIALQLIERMPEKRIAQVLALMHKDKALQLTKILSERGRAR